MTKPHDPFGKTFVEQLVITFEPAPGRPYDFCVLESGWFVLTGMIWNDETMRASLAGWRPPALDPSKLAKHAAAHINTRGG